MGSAEQGGNHPRRVLFIGGPKHGLGMNLPADQDTYEFVFDKVMSGWDEDVSKDQYWRNYPQTASHTYKYDPLLTEAVSGATRLSRTQSPYLNLFTHQAIWGTPYKGGYVLHAINEADKALVKARDDAASSVEKLETQRTTIGDLNCELLEKQGEANTLADEIQRLEERLTAVRVLLEQIGLNVWTAIQSTGRKYASPFDQPED